MLHGDDAVFHLWHFHDLVHKHFPILNTVLVLDAFSELNLRNFEKPLLHLLCRNVAHVLFDKHLRNVNQLNFCLVFGRGLSVGLFVLDLRNLDDALNNFRCRNFSRYFLHNDLRHLEDFLNPNVRLPDPLPFFAHNPRCHQRGLAHALLDNSRIWIYFFNEVVVVSNVALWIVVVRSRSGWWLLWSSYLVWPGRVPPAAVA
mmetsp:Transcript_13558/g.31888  ORF Transcript_13558/g.31888 Transcript_13558/m.31888 type:complete len:201 (+) Transcript_13558:271-873(+)